MVFKRLSPESRENKASGMVVKLVVLNESHDDGLETTGDSGGLDLAKSKRPPGRGLVIKRGCLGVLSSSSSGGEGLPRKVMRLLRPLSDNCWHFNEDVLVGIETVNLWFTSMTCALADVKAVAHP